MNSKLLIEARTTAINKKLINCLELLLLLTYDTDLDNNEKITLIGMLTNHRRLLIKEHSLAAVELENNKAMIYSHAAKKAAKRLERRQGALPQKCPFGIKQILNSEFIPQVKELPYRSYQITNPQELFADLGESGYESIRCEQHMKNHYYILRRRISNKVCSILAIPPGLTELSSGAIFSVTQKPKQLFGAKFPKENLKEVTDFIKRNEVIINQFWRGKINPQKLLESLYTDRGYQIIERSSSRMSFTSNGQTWKVTVWAHSSIHIRLANQCGIDALLDIKTFEAKFYDQVTKKWKQVKRSVITDFKKFLNLRHSTLDLTNEEALKFIFEVFIDSV